MMPSCRPLVLVITCNHLKIQVYSHHAPGPCCRSKHHVHILPTEAFRPQFQVDHIGHYKNLADEAQLQATLVVMITRIISYV